MESSDKGITVIICAIIFGFAIIQTFSFYNSRMESEAAIKAGLQQMVVNNNTIWVKNALNDCED